MIRAALGAMALVAARSVAWQRSAARSVAWRAAARRVAAAGDDDDGSTRPGASVYFFGGFSTRPARSRAQSSSWWAGL